MSNQVPQNQICINRNYNKYALVNKTNKSSSNSRLIRYSTYIQSRRNSHVVYEGQVNSLKMTLSTPNTATLEFTYSGKPSYIKLIVQNIQLLSDIQTFTMTSSPYTITGLTPNSYYMVDTYTMFNTGNEYKKTYLNSVSTLNEGPPLNVNITNPLHDHAILNFTPSIGNPSRFILDVINSADATDVLNFQNVTSPFMIVGLTPNTTYDISLSSYYNTTSNSYVSYTSSAFETFFENYTAIADIINLTNMSATLSYVYTGYPTDIIFTITNANLPTDTYTISNIGDSVTFSDIRIDASYNISINTIYSTGHNYITSLPNAFHTLNESLIENFNIIQILGDSLIVNFTKSYGNPIRYTATLSMDT